MKVTVILTEQEVKIAAATYINQVLRIPCDSSQIKYQRYGYVLPTLDLDTDEVQAEASLIAEQTAAETAAFAEGDN